MLQSVDIWISSNTSVYEVSNVYHCCCSLALFSQNKMPRRCSVYNCEGNYNGQPYTQTVSASIEKYPEDRKRRIEAMPNHVPAHVGLRNAHERPFLRLCFILNLNSQN